jgi:exonuclease V gamma subunit
MLAHLTRLNLIQKRIASHQLIVTNNSHNTQRLHTILLRIEFGITKHDIRVQIGIEILNAKLAQLVLESSFALPRRVRATVSALIIQTVAVYVHVVILAAVTGTVEVDCPVDVAAVGEG